MWAISWVTDVMPSDEVKLWRQKIRPARITESEPGAAEFASIVSASSTKDAPPTIWEVALGRGLIR